MLPGTWLPAVCCNMPQSMETDSEATESGPADERIRLLRNAGKRVSGYMVSRRRILES